MESILQTLGDHLGLPWTPLYTQTDEEASSSNLVEVWILAATILFTVVVFLFENYLDLRQQRAYHVTEFPKELEEIVQKMDTDMERERKSKETDDDKKDTPKEESKKEEETDVTQPKADRNKPILPQLRSIFEKAQAYGKDKIQFSIIHSSYEVIESVTFLLLGFLPYLWDCAEVIGKNHIPYMTVESEIGISLVFMGLVTVVGTITSLPFEWYSTFKIEKKHGFNKQTIGLFISDKLKGLMLMALIGGPFLYILLKIIHWGGPHFYVYVWVFTFIFSVLMMTIVPVFIMPLFNKYTPLEEGGLRTSIFDLAKRLKYPLTKLFVMDGSKRSSHSNAFMFGFGSNKRIVLFDTLLTQVHNSEILAILGHELGHWKLGHTLLNFGIAQIYTGAMMYTFAQCYNSHHLYTAFGFSESKQAIPTIIKLILFSQTIWAPMDKILSFLTTLLSRECEFAADRFSVHLGMSQDLQSGLCKIHLENLGSLCPDRLYAMYHYSHPQLVERLKAMMKLDKKKLI